MKRMIPIWFFVGCLLAAYGVLILFAGIRDFSHPPGGFEAMQHLHLPIWWGIFMMTLGLAWVVHFRPRQ